MIVAKIRIQENTFVMKFDTFADAHEYVCATARVLGPGAVHMISSYKESADDVDDLKLA